MTRKQHHGWPDAHGVKLCQVRNWLPARVSSWPRVPVVKNPRPAEIMRERFATWSDCWICGKTPRHGPQVHHIASGPRKSDELTNLILVGGEMDCGCHTAVQSDAKRLVDCFRAKWTHDRETLDWVRLVLLWGRWPGFDEL